MQAGEGGARELATQHGRYVRIRSETLRQHLSEILRYAICFIDQMGGPLRRARRFRFYGPW